MRAAVTDPIWSASIGTTLACWKSVRWFALFVAPAYHHMGFLAGCAMETIVTPNYAMQRSSRVGTPLAGTGPGADGQRLASGAPTARRR